MEGENLPRPQNAQNNIHTSSDKKRILIICLSGMGNFLLFTPSLAHYRKCFPNATIDVCIRWSFLAKLLEPNKIIDNCFVFDEKKYGTFREKLGFMKELRKNKYDMTICAFPTNRWQYNILAFSTGAPLRYSFSYPKSKGATLSILQNHKIPAEFGIHDVLQNLRLAEFATGVKPEKPVIHTTINKIDLSWGKKFVGRLKKKRVIVLHPSFDPSQAYKGGSVDRITFFADLINKINKKYKCGIIIIGGPKEKDDVIKLEPNLSCKVSFALDQNIGQSAGIIAAADLLVNIDSGLGHIASVVKTPSITLYGPALPERTKPFNENQFFIQKAPPGRKGYQYPFYSSRQEADCNADEWFSRISVDDVILHIEAMVKQKFCQL
jgi:ADP-heptose:LPS heptosyltransferase